MDKQPVRKMRLSVSRTRCPNCKSYETVQVNDHSTTGVNEFVCSKCGCRFGN